LLPPIKIKLDDFDTVFHREKNGILGEMILGDGKFWSKGAESKIPPIKIKLVDKNIAGYRKFSSAVGNFVVGLSTVNDKNVETSVTEPSTDTQPIKIKICDRDKDMSLSYQKKYARVREQIGLDELGFTKSVIKVKPVDEILPTDQVLEYLSPDYIKPIRIKIPDLDVVYMWLYDLLFRFNFSSLIAAGMALVVHYGKFVTKLKFKDNIFATRSTFWGLPRFHLKFKDLIAVALDIFKIDGLKSKIRLGASARIIQIYQEQNLHVSNIVFNTPDISKTIIFDIKDKTIGELAEGTLSDELFNKRYYDMGTERTVWDVLHTKVPRNEGTLSNFELGTDRLGDNPK